MTRHSADTFKKACTFIAGTLATFSQGPAQAQCTATSNAPTATCTGDLSSGVFLENIGQTTVTDLRAPITSGITVLNGWYLPDNAPDDQPGQAGPPGSLGFSDPNYGVSTSVQPGLAIFVGGQDGGNGSGTATTGNPGQSGGVGGTTTLTISAPSLASLAGPQQPGGIVTVQSEGGSGGNGYIPPQQSDGSDDSTLTGGAGGSGGAGGAASLTVSVPSVTLTGDGTAILVQSSGGNAGGARRSSPGVAVLVATGERVATAKRPRRTSPLASSPSPAVAAPVCWSSPSAALAVRAPAPPISGWGASTVVKRVMAATAALAAAPKSRVRRR